LAAGAPVLGAIGLAGAWPALAARGRSVWQRAAFGITGWVWLAIAASLADTDLYTSRPGGAIARSGWSPSLHGAVHHVLAPLLSGGMLAAAAVWGAAAVALPWISSGRSLALDASRVALWSIAVVAATGVALALGHSAARPATSTAAVGALAAALVALAPALRSAWRDRPRSTDIEHQVP